MKVSCVVVGALLVATVDSVGIGMGVRLMIPAVPAAPTVPLGVTSIQDSQTGPANTTVVAVEKISTPTEPESPPAVWKEHLETILKVLGTMSNIVLQLSPLRLITDMRMSKAPMGFSAAPLLALTACGYQWSFYGYFAFTATANVAFLTLVYANILGLVLGLYFLANFYVYTTPDRAQSMLRDGLIALVAFAVEGVYCALETDVSKALVCAGLLSAALSICVSFSPMVSLRAAIAEKSIKAMPVDIILASFVSSLLWAILGTLLNDPWVWIPNATGLMLGLVQLGACAYIQTDQKSIAKVNHALLNVYKRISQTLLVSGGPVP